MAVQQPPGITRTDLRQRDLSAPGREVIQNRVDISPDASPIRHKHPGGEEIVYVLEGSLEYSVDGQSPMTINAGEVFFVPADTVHAVRNVGKAQLGRNALTALPVEGRMPGFERAAGWLNSEPLAADDLRGKVVLADFCTYTCINWLRTLGYVRAWAETYEDQGLVVVGVHTPEFPFEAETENVVEAVKALNVEFPIALDPEYAVWEAFSNRYWPAVYIADAEGQIRHHQFGEGGYDECERVIQQLLREAGGDAVSDDLISVIPEGVEAQADWGTLGSPETYVGYQQGRNFASPEGVTMDDARTYSVPDPLRLDSWALSGDWTVEGRATVLNRAAGSIAFRFHARDVNLVLRSRDATAVPFRVLLDGAPPSAARGLDVDDEGNGTLVQPRLYQLIRQPGSISDRTFEITFDVDGVEAYVFTFG